MKTLNAAKVRVIRTTQKKNIKKNSKNFFFNIKRCDF